MAVASTNAGGYFSVGDVLNRALNVCAANFVLFFAVTLVVSLPSLLFKLLTPAVDVSSWTGDTFLIAIILFLTAIIVSLFLNTIGEAVILYGAFQYLRGQPVVLGEALKRGLARFFPILGFAILYSIALLFASLLLVVPGIILFIMWTAALPACVVEGLGPLDSMQRSSRLTKGYRWKIFGIMILLIIISAIVGGIVDLILVQVGDVAGAFGTLIWAAVWSAYWNCVLVMIYHDLRVAKEGIDIEQIAAIFD